MIVFVLLFFALCVYKMKITPHFFEGRYYEDYLSVEKTTAIKGIFICVVFFKHIGDYIEYTTKLDNYSMLFVKWGFQTLVTMFFFYSGYGIMESIKKKGLPYVKTIPTKRITSVLYRFDLIVLIFIVLHLIYDGFDFGLKKVVLALVGWDSFGNSNWYIFAVLLLYVFTYLAFRFIKNHNISLIILTGITCVYIVFMLLYFRSKGTCWFNTVLCYPLGVFWSLYGEKLCKLINKNLLTYILSFIVIGGAFAVTWYYRLNHYASFVDYGVEMVMNLLFVLTLVLITMKVQIHNKILNWLGTHLFELYILQRIPMLILSNLGLNDFNKYLFVLASAVCTICLGAVVKPILDKTWAKIVNINTKKVKSN